MERDMMNTAGLGSEDGREIQEALICKKNGNDSNGDRGDVENGRRCSSSSSSSVIMSLICTAVAVCGSFEFGTCVGFTAPTQIGISDELGLSLSQFSIFGSILTIGGVFGSITSGGIAEIIGRKGAMRISSIVCIFGWLAIYFANTTLPLYCGRLATGYGIGILSYVVPVFIAEIAPQNLRGGLTTVTQLMICSGSSAAYIVGAIVSWRALVLVGIFPCIFLFLGLFFIPESPRWLAKIGRQKEFRVALQTLRGKGTDTSEEASDIQENVDSLKDHSKARFRDIFQKKYYRPIGVGVGLMVFQQLSGCNGIGFYASKIFTSAGFSSGDIGTILMGSIQVPITMVGAILMDRSGRRSLLMVSATGTFLGTFIAGLAFYLKGQGLFLDWIPSLVLIGILVYTGCFSIGMGAIPWVIMSEIFPIRIKGVGGSLVTLVNWSGSWVVSYAFNFFMSWSSSGTFFIFSAASAVTVFFVNKIVPETKGRTLEEIENSINS